MCIQDVIVAYRKHFIPDAFTIPTLSLAAGFEGWLHTVITKVRAAAQGVKAVREWVAKVKRGPDFDKYESADNFEALDIKLASALIICV